MFDQLCVTHREASGLFKIFHQSLS